MIGEQVDTEHELRRIRRGLADHSKPVGSVILNLNYASPLRLTASCWPAGGSGQTIKLWEVASVREVRTLTGHSDSVNAVAFSPNGQLLASGSNDGTVKLWQ